MGRFDFPTEEQNPEFFAKFARAAVKCTPTGLLYMKVLGEGFARQLAVLTRKFANQQDDISGLMPVLLSGSGRTGSVALMSLLASDDRLVFDQQYPFESRYLTYFLKFSLFVTNPEYFPFIDGGQLFNLNTLGVAVVRPQNRPEVDPKVFIGRSPQNEWLSSFWRTFSAGVRADQPNALFYAEKAPQWLPAAVRAFMKCFVIHNFRDPRDIFLSANAFMKKQRSAAFGRRPGDTDLEYARGLALSFAISYEKYYADRARADSVLVRYEDLVEQPREVCERLQKMAGLQVSQAGSAHFEQHRTATDLRASVRRWQREPIPEDVKTFFNDHLHDEMNSLGYPVKSPAMPFKRTIAFGRLTRNSVHTLQASDGYVQEREDSLEIDIKAPNFSIILPSESFEAKLIRQVWVSISGDMDGHFSLYWRVQQAEFAETRSMHVGYSALAGCWVVSFPVQSHPEWKGTIHQLRLNVFDASKPRNFKSSHRGRAYLRWVRLVS